MKIFMQYKGVNYHIGTRTITGGLTREIFDLDIVTEEIKIIKNELHCNAMRISGLYIERIVTASEIALQVRYLIQSAVAAEKLRAEFSNLIFVAGCELSLFINGFVQGRTGEERLKTLFGTISLFKNILGINRKYNKRLNKFLSKAVDEIKKNFMEKSVMLLGHGKKLIGIYLI